MEVDAFERVYEAFGDFHAFFAPAFGRKQWREHTPPAGIISRPCWSNPRSFRRCPGLGCSLGRPASNAAREFGRDGAGLGQGAPAISHRGALG